MQQLLADDLYASEVREMADRVAAAEPGARRLFARRVPTKHLATFTRQLATMIGAGTALVPSLDVLTEQIESDTLRDVVTQVQDSVQRGSSFAEGLEQHPHVFSKLFTSMVAAGEASGTLDTVLERLADLTEKQQELRGNIQAAIAYPVFVLCLAAASAMFLLTFALPKLVVVFEGVQHALPLPTRILMAAGDFFQAWWVHVMLGTVVAFVALRIVMSWRVPRELLDRALLNLPMFGAVFRKLAVARFARTFGVLVRCGVTVFESLELVSYAAGNSAIAAAVIDARERVRHGDSVAAPLRDSGVFLPMAVHMIAVGEQTGRLDEMLLRLADAYERETDAAIRTMMSLLAPLLILVVGAVVGFMILALLLPIFEMHELIR